MCSAKSVTWGADFIVDVRFNQQAMALPGAEMNVTDCDAAAAGLQDRRTQSAPRSRRGDFKSGSPLQIAVDLPIPLLPMNATSAVLPPENKAGRLLDVVDVFREAPLECMAHVRMVPQLDQFPARQLRLPKQILIRMIEGRSRDFTPVAAQRLRKLERFRRSDGLGDDRGEAGPRYNCRSPDSTRDSTGSAPG